MKWKPFDRLRAWQMSRYALGTTPASPRMACHERRSNLARPESNGCPSTIQTRTSELFSEVGFNSPVGVLNRMPGTTRTSSQPRESNHGCILDLAGRALRNKDGSKDSRIEGDKLCLMLPSQLKKMSVCQLRRCFCEAREAIDTKIVSNQLEWNGAGLLQLLERLARRCDVRLKSRLHGDADESEFRDRTRAQAASCAPCRLKPRQCTGVMHVRPVGQCDQGVDVEQVLHGKSASAART
jgi:hypothetical protein